MGLPIVLNAPKYELQLPLSKKTIEYRPYLVKEEKLLMMAIESGDQKMVLKAVQDIIDACTFNEVRAKTLPTAELEYIFLKLRSKSVGETSTVGCKCEACQKVNEVSINLETIDIKHDASLSNKVFLTDDVGVLLKYPTSDDVSKIASNADSNIKNTFNIINSCIEAIFDSNAVYKTEDLDKKDIETFIDSLNATQFEKIKTFFEGIPRLYKDVDFKCECGHDNHITLEGLQNFFV